MPEAIEVFQCKSEKVICTLTLPESEYSSQSHMREAQMCCLIAKVPHPMFTVLNFIISSHNLLVSFFYLTSVTSLLIDENI